MALSEIAILAAVSLGFGLPLYRAYVARRDDRRRKPAERFAHACREAGFVPDVSDGNTWRGRILGDDVIARCDVVDGFTEIAISSRLSAPLRLGLELATSGRLADPPEGSRARALEVAAGSRIAARAIDVERATALVWRIVARLTKIEQAGFTVEIDDDEVRLRNMHPFTGEDLAKMLAALSGLRGEIHAARSRGGIAAVDDDLAIAWAMFAEKRGLTMSAGPTLSGVLSQVSFEASIQLDRVTGARTTDVVLLETIEDGRMFSLVARAGDERASAADLSGAAGEAGATGDAALDRRFRLLVSSASGRAVLENERLRSLLLELPASVGTVHLASLGLRLGTTSLLEGDEIEELVRHGDEVVRVVVGRASEVRAPYR